MIREYKLNTAGQLDLGWRDVEFWLSLFPNLTQADLDNPRLFTPNLESVVEPQNKKPMEKIYVLQKDLPMSKIGEQWEISSDLKEYVSEYNQWITLPVEFVENNPEWFLPKKEQEWEIQSFINATNDVVLTRFPDGLYRWKQQHSGDTSEALLAMPHMKIYSVKRLSDGQTFSVSGDYYYGSAHGRKGKILKFKLLPDNEMVVEIYPDGETNSTGSIFRNLDELSQQPPQEEQKDNYVFVWDDAKVKDAVELAWLTGVTKNGIAPKKFIDDFKASKSTLASEKITLEWVALHEGKHNYNLVVPSGIDIDKVEQVKKAIWNVLNNYPNPEFGKAAYERLFDQNQQILEENSKMYVDTQKKLREAFEAARIGSRSISDKDGQMIGGFTYKDFDSYLQSLNNK